MGRTLLFLFLTLFARAGTGEVCAKNYTELGQTERLRTIQSLFQNAGWLGLINETKGTYITLISKNDKMNVSLFTSGLFDLYPISRESEVQFCDEGKSLELKALGRTQTLSVRDGKLIIGDGGPRRTFSAGDMPQLLRKLHHLDARGVAFSESN